MSQSATTPADRLLLTCDTCAGSYKAAQLLEWVSEVLLLEDQLAYEYWVIMFPLVWGSLSDKKDNQVFLAKPVIQLLSQEYHHRQADKRPNVIPVRFALPSLPFLLRAAYLTSRSHAWVFIRLWTAGRA